LYSVENAAKVFKRHRQAAPTDRRWVNRTVLALGLTSLFTDISSEMITAVLPLYLVFGLHLSPLVFGVVDGMYSGAPHWCGSWAAIWQTVRVDTRRWPSPVTPCQP
jgi:hypothetical protein